MRNPSLSLQRPRNSWRLLFLISLAASFLCTLLSPICPNPRFVLLHQSPLLQLLLTSFVSEYSLAKDETSSTPFLFCWKNCSLSCTSSHAHTPFPSLSDAFLPSSFTTCYPCLARQGVSVRPPCFLLVQSKLGSSHQELEYPFPRHVAWLSNSCVFCDEPPKRVPTFA